MKYCVLIMDGSAGWPLPERDGKTCLELAVTPNLDAMANEGMVGLANTIPKDMEPSSASACMSLLGYDPKVYYKGRAAIEAVSMGVPITEGEVVFRCNLVSTKDGRMNSYCAGHIGTNEAAELIKALNEALGRNDVIFYTGVSYRHLLKLKGHTDTLEANCTPPHDISGEFIEDFLPRGRGSRLLKELMHASRAVLKEHPINTLRRSVGDLTADMIWLFWGSGRIPDIPVFLKSYGLSAALTSGVDLLRGLGRMMGMDILEIPGVTDGLDNDFQKQISGALESLNYYDMVVVHIEAPDEAGHAGSIDEKIEAIQFIDRDVIRRLRIYNPGKLRLLVMPDHPTPIETRTHVAEPVPFVLWGKGFVNNGAERFTELEAKKTGLFIQNGYNIMSMLVARE
ncbi:MAG: cofactor-independent phosphoglycerate mutase [Dehalococcoidia bacterium]|nr:MAG: cofactor-independent phosphoglycerate mutase [Dehalococcoidia bacterium]